jgi:hypothetical protein
VQAASLIGPETRALIADAQKKRLEAQNAAVRAQALASYIPDLATTGAASDIAGNRASEATNINAGLSAFGARPYAQQIAANQGIARRTITGLAANNPYGVATMPIRFGDITVPGVISPDGGAVTPFGGPSFLNAAMTQPSGDEFIPTGDAPTTDPNGNLQYSFQRFQKNAYGKMVPVGKPVFTTNPNGPGATGAPAAPGTATRATPPVGTPVTPSAPTGAAGANAPTTPKELVNVPGIGLVAPDSNDALAWGETKSLAKTYEGVRVDTSTASQKDRIETQKDNSDAITVGSQQAMALGYLQEAFDRMNQQGVTQGSIGSFLPPQLLSVIGETFGIKLDGSVDAGTAALTVVEKMGSELKNIRAYAGIKELLVKAKPDVRDTPAVTARKMRELREGISLIQNRAQAINEALELNIPVAKARRIGDKFYSMSASGASEFKPTPSEAGAGKPGASGAEEDPEAQRQKIIDQLTVNAKGGDKDAQDALSSLGVTWNK